MTPQSAKAKGRKLQQYVRDRLLAFFPDLKPDDVRSTSMGAGGEDVQLSYWARQLVPHSIECKNRASFAIYKDYDQAQNFSPAWEPLLVIKANHRRPLAVVDLDFYLQILKESQNKEF